MKKFKEMTAVALTAAMVLGSSITAFADASVSGGDPVSGGDAVKQGTVTGSGTIEGTVDKDVWNVVLPTTVDPDPTYNFILDPEGLIKATNNAHYSGKTFEDDATMFFNNSDADKTKDYSSTSDAKQIVNKSSYAVDVTVEASVTAGAGISINPDKTFASDTDPSFYLALKDSRNQEQAVAADGTASMTSVMAAPTDGSYEIVFDGSTSTYKYQLKADVQDSAFDKYSFRLTGASNKNATWTGLESETSSVDVVYSVDKHVGATNQACKLQTVVSGTGTDITSAITPEKGIYISINGTLSTASADDLTDVKINGTSITPATKGNSSGNGGAVYFKLPTNKSLSVDDVIAVTLDGVVYEFTIAS